MKTDQINQLLDEVLKDAQKGASVEELLVIEKELILLISKCDFVCDKVSSLIPLEAPFL